MNSYDVQSLPHLDDEDVSGLLGQDSEAVLDERPQWRPQLVHRSTAKIPDAFMICQANGMSVFAALTTSFMIAAHSLNRSVTALIGPDAEAVA